jgi:hypothetical protein
MSDSRLIHSEPFPGVTVCDIRALMQRFVAHHPRGWESTNGELLISFYEPDQGTATRGSWAVLHPDSSGDTKGWAGIEAYQQPGQTIVDFWDGYFPGAPPGLPYPRIGAAFEEFCEMFIGEVQAASGKQAEPQADSGAVAERPTLAEDEDSSLVKILFLAANPADTDRLRLDAEMRDINLALQQTAFRDRFDITMHGAVRAADLQGYLLRHKPDIVHFSGHGDPSSEIVLEDSSGKSHPVSVRALSKLFSVLKDDIRCVVLNACYSEQQAEAIAEHIDCVIGMSKAIGDKAAISFAAAFYQALGYGKSVKTAFDLGCAQIDLENLGEQDTPKLLALNNDPETVVFVHNSSK